MNITDAAQECYNRARISGRPTREIAAEMIHDADPVLVEAMAIEFLVATIARAQRAKTLEEERAAERSSTGQAGEAASVRSTIPRKGTKARAEWERDTPEGREWVAMEDAEWLRSFQMLNGVVGKALDRYAEDLRIKWTDELLDSTFALGDGSLVTWGDATIVQHEERRQVFLGNAHANMEGAARHEVAVRELKEAGAETLRGMVAASAT